MNLLDGGRCEGLGGSKPGTGRCRGMSIVSIAVSSQVGLSVSKVERQRHGTRMASK